MAERYSNRRVAVTGLEDVRPVISGVHGHAPVGEIRVTPFEGQPTAWDNIVAGQSGITHIRETNLAKFKKGYRGLPAKIAAGINYDPDSDPRIREERKTAKFWGRPGKLAFIAMAGALEDARVDRETTDPYRIGHYTGSVFGGAHYSHEMNLKRVRPTDGPKELFAQTGLGPAMRNNLKGRGGVVAVECASGAFAVEAAVSDILPQVFRGEILESKADMVVATGVDAPLTPTTFRVFGGSFGEAVDFTNGPEWASRPFDKDTAGLVMGEAVCSFLIEPWDKAEARGLRPQDIHAEIAGFASLTDANTLTLAGMEGGITTMVKAMKMAKVAVGETVYLNAHETGTILGGTVEALMIREAIRRLGLNPDDIYLNSTKGATGHTMGAAGAIELYFAMMALRHGVVPPALKLYNLIPELTHPFEELEFTSPEIAEEVKRVLKHPLPLFNARNLSPLEATPIPIDVAVSNSFGFAGGAETIVLRNFEP